MLAMLLVFSMDTPNACSWYTSCRKFLIPATAPEGGKDSTKTDHSLDDLHRRFPERPTVFKEASEQRKTIRIAGAGFTNYTSAENLLCNIGSVFERNLSIMPLRSIPSILDDSLHRASGSHATIRSQLHGSLVGDGQLHGNEIKIPEKQRLMEMHKSLRKDAIKAGHSETFICTPPT